MASVLHNILNISIGSGVTSVNPHLINEEGVSVIPDKVEVDNPDYVVTAVDATNVTLRNDGANLAVCNVYCQRFHSTGHSTPGGAAITPRPFLPERIRSGGGSLGVFGDGSDGDVVAAALVTLARDMYYNSFDSNGQVVDTAGFRMFVRGNLTVNGGSVLGRPGNAGGDGAVAAAGAAGAALAAASLGDSAAGGAGGSISPGGAGNATAESWGGDAGVGGAATGQAGGALALAVNPVATTMQPRALPAAITMFNYATLAAQSDVRGGAGGGGGGAAGASGGGGGGGGGGVVMIAARNITVLAGSFISADGGAGGAGFAAADAGGGGGGGGGAISLVYENFSNAGVISAAGGRDGAAGGGGASTAGAVGTAGTIFQLDMKA